MLWLQLKLATILQLGTAFNFVLPFLQCTVHLRNSGICMQFHGDSQHQVFNYHSFVRQATNYNSLAVCSNINSM